MTTGGAGSTGLHVGLPGVEAEQVVTLAHAYSEPVDATVARAIRTLHELSRISGRRRPVTVPLPRGEVVTVWASRSRRARTRYVIGAVLLLVGLLWAWVGWS